MAPHINLSSFAGGGKTTIARLLMANHRTFMIPKFTTRPRREGENLPEYVYVSRTEFEERRQLGHFLAVTDFRFEGEVHHHAIPMVEHWGNIPSQTELVLSLFGSKAPMVKEFCPDMKLCFISFRDKNILRERLRRRCEVDGSDFERKSAVNEGYILSGIEKDYDMVVYNDTTPEECVRQIIELL